MPDSVETQLYRAINEGFKDMKHDIAHLGKETNNRIEHLEKKVHEMSIRMAPILKSFDNDDEQGGFEVRLRLVEIHTKNLMAEVDTWKNRFWTLAVGVVISLVSVLWTLLQESINKAH